MKSIKGKYHKGKFFQPGGSPLKVRLGLDRRFFIIILGQLTMEWEILPAAAQRLQLGQRDMRNVSFFTDSSSIEH
jgi:hypothetical protein